jgi:hypothetical protein
VKSGSKSCPFCGTRMTFEDYELVDAKPADQPCVGCERLFAILAASALRKAEMKQAEQPAEAMDLSPSAILARLLEIRRRQSEPDVVDFAKAAAGDVD